MSERLSCSTHHFIGQIHELRSFVGGQAIQCHEKRFEFGIVEFLIASAARRGDQKVDFALVVGIDFTFDQSLGFKISDDS